MNLLLIKELAEKGNITIRSLALASNMSEVNLHRCIRENKIQAQDLEKIAKILKVSICTFFEENGHIVVNGNQNQVNNETANQIIYPSKKEIEIKLMEDLLLEKDKMIAEKERVIQLLINSKIENVEKM